MFNPQRFKHSSGGASTLSPDLWLYGSTESLKQTQVENYFVDAGMKDGDLLYLRAKDGTGLFTVVIRNTIFLERL